MRLVITYDISDDRIRRHVFRTLEEFGAWKQYSVFELEIDSIERIELEDMLKSIIESTDKIRIYSLCERCINNTTELGEQTQVKKSNVI